jgi:hypothetical protein
MKTKLLSVFSTFDERDKKLQNNKLQLGFFESVAMRLFGVHLYATFNILMVLFKLECLVQFSFHKLTSLPTIFYTLI